MPSEKEILESEASVRSESEAWTNQANASARNRPDARTNTRSEVLSTFHFYVQMNGITEAVFTQVEGLEMETEVTTVAEGGVNDHEHKLLGRTKVSDITLRNGMTTSTQLWDWYKKVIQGPQSWPPGMRRHLSIVMVDQMGREAHRWDLQYAIPVKWSSPQFNAGQSNTAVQVLKLTHEGLVLR